MVEVILLQRIEKLGQMGDVVKVKNGYARNYLLAQKKALRATRENMERFKAERTRLEAQNLEHRKEAEAVAAKVRSLSIMMLRQASDNAQLYGSVNARDIARAVSETGLDIERRQVQLAATIKTLGIHPVQISLHPEVAITVNVNVARSQEEADAQSKAGAAVGPPEAAAPEAGDEEVAAERFFEETALEEAEKDIAVAEAGESEAGEPEAGEAETEKPEAGEAPDEAAGATEAEEEKR